jgi:hypothetical protein
LCELHYGGLKRRGRRDYEETRKGGRKKSILITRQTYLSSLHCQFGNWNSLLC